MHVAAASGQKDILLSLLRLGAPLQSKNIQGATPILVAVVKANLDMVHILLGMSFLFFSLFFFSFFFFFSLFLLFFFLLACGSTLDVRDKSGFAPLHYAVNSKDETMLETLITKHHQQVNAKSDGGVAPITPAVQYASSSFVSLLLKHGALPTNKCDYESPILSAVKANNLEKVRYT